MLGFWLLLIPIIIVIFIGLLVASNDYTLVDFILTEGPELFFCLYALMFFAMLVIKVLNQEAIISWSCIPNWLSVVFWLVVYVVIAVLNLLIALYGEKNKKDAQNT